MAVAQKAIFSTMILAALAALSTIHAAALAESNPSNPSSVLLPKLMTRYDSYPGVLQRLALRSSDTAVQADLSTCNPPCQPGRCCLQTSPDTQATCQRMRLSSQSCVGVYQYTSSNPSPSQALQQSVCPCDIGMICMPGAVTNACSFFRK